MKFKFFILFLISNLLSGQNTNDDPNLLLRIEALEKRMARLEEANSQTQQDLSLVEKKADDAKSASESKIVLPKDENEKKSFMSKLRIELKSEEAKSRGPWTKKETWIEMRRNLTEFKVRKLLGNPNKIKGSLNPRIERVYLYHGDIDADGIEETGFVNFHNGKSVSFGSPFK
ncbi:hypothetical protein N9N13_08615 [Opitutales bacterium]|nr:hypothetical protein [Opitutales bacterium]